MEASSNRRFKSARPCARLDELPQQDFPSFSGNTVHDVGSFWVSERLRRLPQNTQPAQEEQRRYGHLPRVPPLSHAQVLTYPHVCITSTFEEEDSREHQRAGEAGAAHWVGT